MSGVKDSIEWTTHTSGVFTGCFGPGGSREQDLPCSFCYARRFHKRLAGVKTTMHAALKRDGLSVHSPAFSRSKISRLDLELGRARNPRRIFLGSLGDLGYSGPYYQIEPNPKLGPMRIIFTHIDPGEVREEIRGLIENHPRHTFLFLTKQPWGLVGVEWPENAHVGVSASNPDDLARRLPVLLAEVQAGKRWVSIEPLLSHDINRLCDEVGVLDWVVIGAQTGPGYGDPHDAQFWAPAAQRIVRICADRQIPCFAKWNLRRGDEDYPWPTEIPE